MEKTHRPRDLAVTVALFLAAIALLVPMRFDGKPRLNSAHADGENCLVQKGGECCIIKDGWKTCVKDSQMEEKDPGG